MTTGLEIKNDWGSFQIGDFGLNDTAMCLALKSVVVGTFVKSQSIYSGACMCTVSYTSSGNAPLVAVRSSFPVAFYLSFRSGNTWYFRYQCPAANNGQAATFYVFDEAPLSSLPITNFGLEVYNVQATRIYNSGQLPMRITGNNEYEASKDYPSDRTYAVVPSQVEFTIDVFNGNALYITGFVINGGNVSKVVFALGSGRAGWEFVAQGLIHHTVLDVTGQI